MSPPSKEKRFAEDIANRIANGDASAESELFERYYEGVRFALARRSRDEALAEDLAQETLLTVLNRLRESSIAEPEFLHRFIQQTAKYVFIGWTRKRGNQTEFRETVDDAPDETSIELSYEREELRRLVRDLINDITVPRDRELLLRYYVRDQEKSAICDALSLSADHFDKIISRARIRFRDLAGGRLIYE